MGSKKEKKENNISMKKFKTFIGAFGKYYLPNKPKLILTIILSILVFVWINKIYSGLNPYYTGSGQYVLFIKPIFTYVAGLIIIKHI